MVRVPQPLEIRLNAYPQATFVLVVGYSWIDGNLAGIFQNVGIGWEVAWRRWVLVMIGKISPFHPHTTAC